MESQSVAPFENIESAQEYIILLAQAVVESQQMVKEDLEKRQNGSGRHSEALQLVLYNLEKLGHHLKVSRRILNDLRTLRRLLHQERTENVAQAENAA